MIELDTDYSSDLDYDFPGSNTTDMKKCHEMMDLVDRELSGIIRAPYENRRHMLDELEKKLHDIHPMDDLKFPKPVTSELLKLWSIQKKINEKMSEIIQLPREERRPRFEEVCKEADLTSTSTPMFDTKDLLQLRSLLKMVDQQLSLILKAPRKDRNDLIAQLGREVMAKALDTSNEWTVEEVQARRDEIRVLRDEYRALLETQVLGPDQLVPIADGISGSYFLKDEFGMIVSVVKPIDEDISALNNPKGFASVGVEDSWFNSQLYRAPFREVAVSSIARMIDVANVAPKTALAIFQSDTFFDIADKRPQFGPADKEKLCSAMEFVPDAKSLFETQQDLQQLSLTDAEIMARFDQKDVEDMCILMWVTGEADGHGGNILVYEKAPNVFGLKKIDNGLSFPEEKGPCYNSLIYLPNAALPLSDEGREKIRSINVDQITRILQENRLETSIEVAQARIELLKSVIEDPNLTLKQINGKL